jgi:hypothetical protein
VVVAAAALGACKSTSPSQTSSSIPTNAGTVSLQAWTGVKVVKESLDPMTLVDPAAPVAVSGGLSGLYVQWNRGTSAAVSLFNWNGAEQPKDPLYQIGGRAGRGLAVPSCVDEFGHTKDCPLLLVDGDSTEQGPTPEMQMRPCSGTPDFGVASYLGMIIPAGTSRAFLAGKYNEWTFNTKGIVTGKSDEFDLMTTVIDASSTPCAFTYDEEVLYSDPSQADADGYHRGRLLALPGVPSGFTVGAAARLGTNGMVVAGMNGVSGPAWVVSLDSSFAPLHQGSIAIGGITGLVTSAAVDAAGNVFVCGLSRFPATASPFINPLTLAVQGWVAQGTPDLASWATVTLPGAVDGCAVGPSGTLVVSGTYSGTFQGVTSKGVDVFLARVTPGIGGAAPAVTAFTRHGSKDDEPVVSAPFLVAGSGYLAGVTLGDWGDAKGVGQAKVFAARFDATTLALQ